MTAQTIFIVGGLLYIAAAILYGITSELVSHKLAAKRDPGGNGGWRR
jgi:hypothetical protein